MDAVLTTRQETNRKLLRELKLIVDLCPEWRFNQILQNLDIVIPNRDQFNDESTETLAAMQKSSVYYILHKS